MKQLLITWVVSAIGLLIVAFLLPGFHVSGFGAAMIAAAVIGLVNGSVGLILKIVTFPITVLTLGLFWIVLNALMLQLAAWLMGPSFVIDGFGWAFAGAVLLSIVNMILRSVIPGE